MTTATDDRAQRFLWSDGDVQLLSPDDLEGLPAEEPNRSRSKKSRKRRTEKSL